MSGSENRMMCGVGLGRALTVDVDGRVYGCVMFASSYQQFPSSFLQQRLGPLVLGRVGTEELTKGLGAYREAVLRAGLFDHKERKYSSYGRCAECEYMHDCAVCPVGIGLIPGNTDPHRIPDFACAFNRVAAEHRTRFFEEVDAA